MSFYPTRDNTPCRSQLSATRSGGYVLICPFRAIPSTARYHCNSRCVLFHVCRRACTGTLIYAFPAVLDFFLLLRKSHHALSSASQQSVFYPLTSPLLGNDGWTVFCRPGGIGYAGQTGRYPCKKKGSCRKGLSLYIRLSPLQLPLTNLKRSFLYIKSLGLSAKALISWLGSVKQWVTGPLSAMIIVRFFFSKKLFNYFLPRILPEPLPIFCCIGSHSVPSSLYA